MWERNKSLACFRIPLITLRHCNINGIRIACRGKLYVLLRNECCASEDNTFHLTSLILAHGMQFWIDNRRHFQSLRYTWWFPIGWWYRKKTERIGRVVRFHFTTVNIWLFVMTIGIHWDSVTGSHEHTHWFQLLAYALHKRFQWFFYRFRCMRRFRFIASYFLVSCVCVCVLSSLHRIK